MYKLLTLLCSVCLFVFVANANNVEASHEINKTDIDNQYRVKTTITGLTEVAIARLTYNVNESYTINVINKGSAMYNKGATTAKFYFISVDESGTISVEFTVEKEGLTSEGAQFPVMLNYSKNEQKFDFQLDDLTIEGTSEPIAAVVEETVEEPAIEEAAETSLESKVDAAIENAETETAEVETEVKSFTSEEPEETPAETIVDKVEESEPAEPVVDEEEVVDTTVPETVEAPVETVEETAEEPIVEGVEAPVVEEVEVPEIVEEVVEAPVEVETPEVKEEVVESPDPNVIYSVQLLSLSDFREYRLIEFCKEHNLSRNDMILRESGNWVKVSYKRLTTKEEAIALRDKLATEKQLKDTFIVKLNK